MTMSRTSRTAVTVMGGLALAVSLIACSDTETQPDAEAAVCASVAEVRTAAAGVAALDTTSTVADAQNAIDALRSAAQALEASAANLEAADSAAVSAAVDQISGAVSDVSGSDSLGSAAAAVQGSTGELDTALTEISDGVQCE